MTGSDTQRTTRARRTLLSCSWILLSLLLAVETRAQAKGALTGSIFNGITGEPVRGATVAVEGDGSRTGTDVNGIFQLELAPGTYQVTFSLEGYAIETLSGVAIEAGAENNVAVVMMPADEDTAQRLAETVTVTASADDATEAALLLERKSADGITDSISREEMRRESSSSAASVMRRVTGVSMVDNKYVYVRGLGERYSTTTMNGAALPTTEPEKRVVPFDLFSSSLLSKVSVLKSYTPDRAGDFGAGIVEMETLDFPTDNSLSVSFGIGWDENTTGAEFGLYGGGLSASGNGGLDLPAAIPDVKLVRQGRGNAGFTREELQQFGRSFENVWAPDYEDAPVGQNVSLTWGGTFGRLGVIVSGNWAEDFDRIDDEQIAFYSIGGGGDLVDRANYTFDTSSQEVRRGLTGSLAYRLSDNGNLTFKAYSTRLSSAEHRYYEGFDSDAALEVHNNRLRYRDEQITTGQFAGEHFLPSIGTAGSLIEWRVSSARGKRDENHRETLYEEIQPDLYVLADESQSGFLLFNQLEDASLDSQLDWTFFLNTSSATGQVKAGAAWTDRDREFGSRRFRFVPTGSSLDLSQSPEKLFRMENIGPEGFELREETRTTDTYTGDHEIVAGYLMADVTTGRWRTIAGARYEQSTQYLRTFDQFDIEATPLFTERVDTDLLPAASLVYLATPATNVRIGYSRTVNRPEFRELAPFEFTDVTGGNAVIGNPDLRQATIDSYDLRWEWFPTAGEVLAASLFYKSFTDPIETVVQSTAQRRQSFENVEGATNWGLELEFRRNLGALAPSLSPLGLAMNYTWVDSRIEIGNPELSVLTNTERPLVGQADHVFNTSLDYEADASGSLFRVLYNLSGDKISEAGSYGLPDVIEESRSTLDFVWLQNLDRFVPRLGLKFSASNLTDEDRTFVQSDRVTRRFAPGREISLSLRYQPF